MSGEWAEDVSEWHDDGYDDYLHAMVEAHYAHEDQLAEAAEVAEAAHTAGRCQA